MMGQVSEARSTSLSLEPQHQPGKWVLGGGAQASGGHWEVSAVTCRLLGKHRRRQLSDVDRELRQRTGTHELGQGAREQCISYRGDSDGEAMESFISGCSYPSPLYGA